MPPESYRLDNRHSHVQRREDTDQKTERVLGDAIVILSALPVEKVRRAYERLMDELLGPDGSAPDPALAVEGGAS